MEDDDKAAFIHSLIQCVLEIHGALLFILTLLLMKLSLQMEKQKCDMVVEEILK